MSKRTVSGIMLTLLVMSMLTLAFNIQPVRAEPTPQLPLGMISYWKFDEGTGTTAFDSVGQNDGIIYGAAWTAGIVDSALSFDGVDDYVSISDSNSLSFSGNGTLELWMKQSGNIGTMLWKRIYAGSYGWTMYLGFPNTVIGYVNDWADWVEATVSPDEWQHIALVYELGMIKLYVNGVLKDTESNPLGFQPTSVNLYIGRDEIGNYFNGLMDEVAIYSVALSASEIQQHYQNGLKGLGYPLTWTVDDDGPADYHTIQEAINAANPGDTIYVHNGTYYENVVVNKTVSLIGENSETTIIDGNKTGSVVTITVNNVTITGFTIQKSGPRGSSGYGPFDCGIFVGSSSGICITGNVVADNSVGIYLDRCSNITLRNNNLTRNTFNLLVGGDIITYGYLHFLHDIDETNTVNESPIYYWIDKHDKQIPYDAGCIYLVNCTNIRVKDIEITNSCVYLVGANNSIVENVKVNFGVIYSGLSQDNRVANNTLTNGAIFLTWSPNNTVAYNVISDSSVGIYLYSSYWWTRPNNNLIVGNTIANCEVGISIPRYADCHNNTIYHNNFINNTKHVDNYNSINFWDNGYPFGGNYWSDYNGTDLHWGSGQDETGSDGIGDTPYNIDVDNFDRYPLMAPFNTFDAGTWNGIAYNVDVVSNSSVSSFAFNPDDGPFLRFNVTGEDGTAGFCRVAIPTDLLWVEDGWTVYAGEESVNYTIITDDDYAYLYFTYNHSTKTVIIQGTHVIPEFQPAMIMPLFMILTMLAVVFAKKKAARRQKT